MKKKTAKKAVVAYSGGLDTSIILPWLRENYDCEVVAVAVDIGQGAELNGLEDKAISSGASSCFIEDAREEFLKDYILPMLQSGAVYEGKYLLGTAIARPLIAKRIIEVAKKVGADAIVHGATGKGNDQVRFELAIKALAPNMTIIAPWREWDIRSREDALDYAEERGIPLPITRETSYSKDQNMWHLSHEGLELEDPANAPNYERILEICKTPEAAPDSPQQITIEFEKGVPIALDGTPLSPVALLQALNEIGANHAIGIVDMVENRLVGMKSRGVYETPGGTILYAAHAALETITLDRDTVHQKAALALRFAELVYYGQWFTPLRYALTSFVDSTQQYVSGKVSLRLYKGNVTLAGVTSPNTLFDNALASFGHSSYDHSDAEGFINLFGLPSKVGALSGRTPK